MTDRRSGRAAEGYSCNLEQVGRYGGEGAAWQMASYGDCAYFSTRLNPALKHRGVQIVDVRDPARPAFQTSLTTPAMLDPWESLAVNSARGLLGASAAPAPLRPIATWSKVTGRAPKRLESVTRTA